MNYKRMTSEDFPDWFVELLMLRATDGLDEQQQLAFDKFVQEQPDRKRLEREAEKYELAVAAIDLHYQSSEVEDKEDDLPESLRRKVLAGAEQHFTEQHLDSASAPVDEAVRPKAEPARDQGLTSREALAWLAAAAAVTLLLTGWNPFAAPAKKVANNGTVVRTPSVEQRFNDFIADEEADLVRVSWTPTDENSQTVGEVLWRDTVQEGYMVFAGLRPNDPLQSQYQLWIFDSKTGDEHPIDGGVFDIATGEETIVPIDAKIQVSGPVMFAITEEQPGGVVVSSRDRLPLIAKVQ